MRFLVDASLPRNAASLVRQCGHEAIDVRDIGLQHAADEMIARHAKVEGLALISADFDFADIRIYSPAEYFGLVIIDRPADAIISEVLSLIERFLSHHDVVANLVGRLVIVDQERIRVRPALNES